MVRSCPSPLNCRRYFVDSPGHTWPYSSTLLRCRRHSLFLAADGWECDYCCLHHRIRTIMDPPPPPYLSLSLSHFYERGSSPSERNPARILVHGNNHAYRQPNLPKEWVTQGKGGKRWLNRVRLSSVRLNTKNGMGQPEHGPDGPTSGDGATTPRVNVEACKCFSSLQLICYFLVFHSIVFFLFLFQILIIQVVSLSINRTRARSILKPYSFFFSFYLLYYFFTSLFPPTLLWAEK